jgi:MFS family permease
MCSKSCLGLFVNVSTAGNILCGLSTTSMAYIVYRGLAGIGAAGILHGPVTFVSRGVDTSLQDRCMKVIVSADILALGSGTLLGGYMTDNINWKWIYIT